jgi:cobalt/nickel transport system permease protein
MRHDFFDRYSRLNSPLHRLPAAAKLAAALGLVIAIVSVPMTCWPCYGTAALILAAGAALSRVPPGFILRRLLLLEPFVLGVSILALFRPDGTTLFLSLIIKSTLCLLTMILLSNTTPFAKILEVLRTIGMPGIIITVLALMYRYLFVLIDEAERMHRARLSRTYTPAKTRWWNAAASVISQLFVRSSERAERIYAAMLSRGWK